MATSHRASFSSFGFGQRVRLSVVADSFNRVRASLECRRPYGVNGTALQLIRIGTLLESVVQDDGIACKDQPDGAAFMTSGPEGRPGPRR